MPRRQLSFVIGLTAQRNVKSSICVTMVNVSTLFALELLTIDIVNIPAPRATLGCIPWVDVDDGHTAQRSLVLDVLLKFRGGIAAGRHTSIQELGLGWVL
jgi:hypothetical protein